MTLIEAQNRYIARVNSCHPGHFKRVSRAAFGELYDYAVKRGMDATAVCRDEKDMAALERNADD